MWDLRSLRDAEKRSDSAFPKLLTTLSDLQGKVICVRWSKDDGSLLAGADDRTIILWKRAYAHDLSFFWCSILCSAKTAGGNLVQDVERWSTAGTLHGHRHGTGNICVPFFLTSSVQISSRSRGLPTATLSSRATSTATSLSTLSAPPSVRPFIVFLLF